MIAIVAVDKNWAIGNKGELLIHIPEDMKFFKNKTYGNIIIVGRKTIEGFPGGKPLPGRKNIVLTRNTEYRRDDCIVCHSKDEVLDMLKDMEHEVFVCGGASIYEQFMDCCDTFYVTKLDRAFEADRYFANLDNSKDILCSSVSDEKKYGDTGYCFAEYKRR